MNRMDLIEFLIRNHILYTEYPITMQSDAVLVYTGKPDDRYVLVSHFGRYVTLKTKDFREKVRASEAIEYIKCNCM